ncbi:hypothetical protein SAMN04490189_0785 [Pseudomonas koreensis]|uniref:hypothetical protein n=1 Tax=Pseudomonas koreensis TaxID=198620 RepID=UPI00087A7B44|nr:hypothetical protein [Pseudomonas koreensis]KAB0510702.1 hypothetical protein F7R05_24200 [Pseudomonas koreensis]NNA59638.1 hypothetical protein [Pseudomonas koreensis]GGK43245.1 hypothetical protein GCM10009103_42330 [Pseudomonas koreensis]SDC87345.1 hypothetical protein SAMN04490189_0785 [Pseudomonas koreensis]
MKGTFNRYDPKTGKGTITPDADPVAQGFSLGAAAAGVMFAQDYPFSIPLAEAGRVKIKKGKAVEFDKPSKADGEATNLKY